MRITVFGALVLCTHLVSCSTSLDFGRLEFELNELLEPFDGRVGLYVEHLPTGTQIAISADSIFPTASMIKVPILVKLFDRIDKGELDYQQDMIYRDSLFYSDDDISGNLKDGTSIKLSALVMLMLTMSDNTASLWLQETAGTGIAINEWLAQNGFVDTRMNSRTEGRRSDWEKFGWGQTTPREMALLLKQIYAGEAVSPAASEEMYRALTRTYWNDEAISVLPPTIQAATKQGAVSASKSEVMVVNGPSGDYLFSLITDEQADTRWESDNAGYVLLRDVSRLLWNTFEPDHPWNPSINSDRYSGPVF